MSVEYHTVRHAVEVINFILMSENVMPGLLTAFRPD